MRNLQKAAATVAALGIAFGVAGCVPDTKPNPVGMAVDQSLNLDLRNVATELEAMGGSRGVTGYSIEMAPTKPGGAIDLGNGSNQNASPGNVIAVKVVENGKGYCVSGYNKSATKATSATKSLLYQSHKGGIQPGVGAC